MYVYYTLLLMLLLIIIRCAPSNLKVRLNLPSRKIPTPNFYGYFFCFFLPWILFRLQLNIYSSHAAKRMTEAAAERASNLYIRLVIYVA